MNVTTRAARVAIVGLVVLLWGSSRKAHADYLFVPFVGSTFAGNTAFLNLEQGAGAAQVVFGGSASWLSSGILGVEGEFAYAPHFFERDNEGGQIVKSDEMTISGSVIVAVPLSVTDYSLRPYAIGGLGLMHSGITYFGDAFDPVDDNSLGVNFGAGAIGFVTQRTGVRFEVRHFRTLDRQRNLATGELSTLLSFWRFTVGVVIRR